MDIIKDCQEDGFLLDIEIIVRGIYNKFCYLEVPINWFDKKGSKVNILKDGLQMLTGLWRIRRNLVKLNLSEINAS